MARNLCSRHTPLRSTVLPSPYHNQNNCTANRRESKMRLPYDLPTLPYAKVTLGSIRKIIITEASIKCRQDVGRNRHRVWEDIRLIRFLADNLPRPQTIPRPETGLAVGAPLRRPNPGLLGFLRCVEA